MANRKKAKEEKTIKSKAEEVTSNIEEKNEENSPISVPTTENDLDRKAAESLEQELKEVVELEELNQPQSNQEEVPDGAEQVANPEPEEKKPKLHILADDRLNSLINTANELGITDIVQILNSDKFGQFYLVYRE